MTSLYDIGPLDLTSATHTTTTVNDRHIATARRQGTQAHAAIARIAAAVPATADEDMPGLIRDAVAAHVVGRENGRLAVARVRVSGLVHQYVRVFLPRTAVFAGAEVSTGHGRADLAWDHPVVGVFYDELKTYRSADTAHDPTILAQLARYTTAGTKRHGLAFAGVRLITLGNTAASLLMEPDGRTAPLWDTHLSPTALTGRKPQ
ncbi:hypothetical protein MM440_05105 [Arsenicicoccus piscis]|uniref:Uncharacterized protein n=1 Tax=Arsenicicoccus piscis TaxID=673954 RepID=A0ABQ6HML6_9MICO|nr:hypothetical protein [Arsenicicoccus piscis]MCH8627178.1 hypothetical protein [Arsenicicoccus piscis]GMA18855.1 hypothetical protein GCM10025862_08760 [Arsenicicoccus piscis]